MSEARVYVGMGFGDEGKGSVVSAETERLNAHWNIRYSGGAQAAHHVVLPSGRWHRFQQFGSGTFSYASTFLSEHVLVHPLRLLDEAHELLLMGVPNPLRNHFIDERALIITPYHTALNQLKERERGNKRHGSTGLGIGETRAYALAHSASAMYAGDLRNHEHIEQTMRQIAEDLVIKACEWVPRAEIDEAQFRQNVDLYWNAGRRLHIVGDDFFGSKVAPDGNLIFEGAQGILLDELYGFWPYNTWTNTTSANALKMLRDADYPGNVTTVGVMRPYMTRHGAGPLPTENVHMAAVVPDAHNAASEWTAAMRYGHLDMPMLRYALEADGHIDEIALTHADEIETISQRVALTYTHDGRAISNPFKLLTESERGTREGQHQLTERLADYQPVYSDNVLEDCLAELPITLISDGPTNKDKQLVRTLELERV